MSDPKIPGDVREAMPSDAEYIAAASAFAGHQREWRTRRAIDIPGYVVHIERLLSVIDRRDDEAAALRERVGELEGLLRDVQGVICSHVNECHCPRCEMYDRINEALGPREEPTP
ncbi:hypothetical protein HN371_00440 [Candidatus Poribacteria bacterium]|nr:hypothetical protein [Candidatus Poribacteria bacterium]